LTPKQRLAIAGHIAPATIFCKCSAIFTGSRPTDTVETDVTPSDLVQSEVNLGQTTLTVTIENSRLAFDTGLLTARGPERLGWAHQTYGEFHAAQYRKQHNGSTRQVLSL